MSEIMCYNHECRGNKDWCCKDNKECKNHKSCYFYIEYHKFLQRAVNSCEEYERIIKNG